MTNNNVYRGDILQLTAQEYSDYGTIEIVVATKDFNVSTIENDFLKTCATDDLDVHFKYAIFLKENKYVVPLDYSEYHLGRSTTLEGQLIK